VTTPRALALRAALALSSLTGDRLAKVARRVLGEARFVALTGAEGNGARDASGALPVSAGHHVDDATGRTFPLVLVAISGASRAQLEDVTERVAQLQRDGVRIRPVFVIDSGALSVFRPHGFVVDHLVDPETYSAMNPTGDYVAYRDARLDALSRAYGARTTAWTDLTRVSTAADRVDRLVATLREVPENA
jgi:hypothetical protein